MMKQIILLSGLIFSSIMLCYGQHHQPNGNNKFVIEEPSNVWILDLIDSLKTQTSLCESCMSPPSFKRYEDKAGRILYRLRYACDDFSSFIEIYNANGETVARCHIDDQVNDCNDFEAYSDFTFTKSLLNIWSCARGFNCEAKDSLGLFREYAILASGSECQDKIRELSISTPFEGYEWKGSNGNISHKSHLMAYESGMYAIAVKDDDGCMNAKSQEVHVYVEKEIPISGDKILCPDEVTYLASQGYASYLWSTGDTTDHIVVEDPAHISVTVTDILGCQDSTSVAVSRIEGRSIRVRAGEEKFYKDQVIPIQLELTGFGYDDIKDITWGSEGELTCDACANPFGKFTDDSEIFVMVTDLNDCVYEYSIVVRPLHAFKEVYTSNVFSPDGDGENDIFMIKSQPGAAIVHTFKVFNRWGVPIHDVGRHEVNDESKGWDGYANGTPLETGVYVYMAEVEFIDGSKKYITGDVLLVQ